jgi:hypothetical protein
MVDLVLNMKFLTKSLYPEKVFISWAEEAEPIRRFMRIVMPNKGYTEDLK